MSFFFTIMTKNNQINAVIYARYSTEMQAEGKSIEGQIFACQEYAKNYGFNIVKIYKDEAQSGQHTDRTAFRQIVEDSKKGLFSAVIVHALTRASRFQDLFDYYSWKNELAQNNVEIYSATENIQNEEVGDLIEFLSLWQSKKEIVNTRKNVMRTMKLNASQAKFNGGTAPLGFDIDSNNNYVINENEAEIIKLIFDKFVNEDKGYLTIAEELNQLGLRTKAGNKFGKNSIRELLKNKKYIGEYEYNRTPARDKNGKRNSHNSKQANEIIIVKNALPSIIDNDLFYKAQEKLQARKHKETNTAIEPYLLSGLLICGNCGASFAGHHITARNTNYYECIGYKNRKNSCINKAIQRDKIESFVLNYLKDLNNPDNRKQIKYWFENDFKTAIKDITKIDKSIQHQLTKLKSDNAKLIDKLIDFDSTTLREKIKSNEQEIEQLEKQIENAKLLNNSQKSITTIKLMSRMDLLNDIDNLSREEQKNLVRQFIKQITLFTNEQGYREIVIQSRLIDLVVPQDILSCFTQTGAGGRT